MFFINNDTVSPNLSCIINENVNILKERCLVNIN